MSARGGGWKRAAGIAAAAFLAGAAAVNVPHGMGWSQSLLVLLAVDGIVLALALAMRQAMEERINREIEEARRRLVAAASHDLRTPLASLRLLADSIDDGVATGETRERYLREIRTHVAVLSGLIEARARRRRGSSPVVHPAEPQSCKALTCSNSSIP